MKSKKYYENPVILTSANKIGVIEADGSAEKYFDFGVPNQAAWLVGPVFKDNQRIILISYEDTTISKIIAGEVLSHAWIYNLANGSINEILDKGREAYQMGCVGILDEEKILWAEIIEGENRLFISDFEGKEKLELLSEGEGFPYGFNLSPDQQKISFHIAGSKKSEVRKNYKFRPGPYAINTINTDGTNRVIVAGQEGHLYFNPVWSPDGEWLAYVDCYAAEDRAHFAADICIGRPDGSEHRVVTKGQSNWFGTSYGSEKNRGGGSNTTQWSMEGETLIYTRLISGSHADCFFDPDLPSHEDLVYKPELARGGTQICTVNPFTGKIEELTEKYEGKWEHHAYYTQGGSHIFYCRAHVGKDNELWIMERNGKNQRLLTRGYENKGAWGYAFVNNKLKIHKE